MPIYEYRCQQGHVKEEFTHLAVDAPSMIQCSQCLGPAAKIPSSPTMMMSWKDRPPITGFDNIFEGTKHVGKGYDGKNRATYRSDKIQVDMGA